ncbi:MAG: sensor histidine kinase, partial [Campylobacterota bacterium]
RRTKTKNIYAIILICRWVIFIQKSGSNFNQNFHQDIYLDEITLESISELKTYAISKDITLVPNIDDLLQIKGYSSLLKVALKNIIKNAIDFSNRNSKVEINNFTNGNNYIISVRDNGIGISKDEIHKIFEEFYRTDKSRNKNSGGTGLGMAISKKIIKLHNGSLDIQSQENKGTNIKIVFKKD